MAPGVQVLLNQLSGMNLNSHRLSSSQRPLHGFVPGPTYYRHHHSTFMGLLDVRTIVSLTIQSNFANQIVYLHSSITFSLSLTYPSQNMLRTLQFTQLL